ncbi:MAG: hypothetical protein ACK57O_19185, partial [Planctomyces sp.]
MSVTLNDVPATTKTVNALVFGAGNVDLFVGSGPYFEDTDDDGDIDDLDIRNPDAIGLAMENGNFAYMVMTPTAGTGAKPKYKALKATADRIELVGIDAFTLSATDLVVEYNSVSNPSNPDDTTVVDFTKMTGGHYTADTGYGTLEFDYSSKLLSAEVGEADLQIASNVFIRGGLAFSKGSPQIVKMSDGTTKTVSGFEIGANDLSVFVGTNGPYWLNATGTEINSKAVGVALENTDVAVTVLKPTAASDKVKYIGLKANSSFFGFVGIDAFQLEASSIVVDLNLASGGGSTSASPVIDFDATFNEQRTVFDTNDNGIVTVGELRALSGETSFEGLYTTEDLDGKSVSYKTLLAALDTGDGTGTTPDGLLQIAEVAAFLSSAHDSLATTSDANNNGRLDVGYEIRMGGESAFLHEQQRRIHAAADDVLLNISEFVYINANMAIDIGARETIIVNSGISSYVAGLLPDGSVDFLNGLLSEFRTQLNNAETTLNNAFESVVTEVQQQVDNVIDQVADKIVEQIQSTLAEAKASVSTLVTAQLSSGTSGLSDLLLTPILDDLTGELLDAVPEGTLRDMVNTIIVEPVESLLKTAFDNLLKEALQDSVDQLVAAVSDALTAGVGKSAEKLKAAIQKAMEPQIARITVKLNGLIAQVQNKLAPVLEKLEGIANLTIGDDFKTIGGLEAEVTAIGISDANAFIGMPPSGGLDFSQPIADQDGIGIFVQNFNMGLAIFKPVLSKQLPTFTAAKITADAAGFTDGGADLLVMTIRDLEVELNLGKPLLNVGPLLGTATIDFERSFPADPGGNSGYVVETGTTSDPITLDFTQERILASVSNVTIQVAEFVYISGSIAFEKGAVRTVKVAPGLTTDAAQAFLDELNLPDNISIPATGAPETELSFMTVGGADLQAFVGIGGPYKNDAGVINDSAVGIIVEDFDFAIAMMKPTNPLEFFTKYFSLKASAEQVSLVGIDDITLNAERLYVELNLSSPAVFGVPLFPVVNYATTEEFASEQLPLFDVNDDGEITLGELATLNSQHNAGLNFSGVSLTDPMLADHDLILKYLDTNQDGILNLNEAAVLLGGDTAATNLVTAADVDSDEKIDPLGLEVRTGGVPQYLSMNSFLIKAQGYIELDIFSIVTLQGSIAFEMGPKKTVDIVG